MAEALLAEMSTGGYRATAQKLRRLAAIARLPEVAGAHFQQEWSPTLMQHILACIALARGQRLLASSCQTGAYSLR